MAHPHIDLPAARLSRPSADDELIEAKAEIAALESRLAAMTDERDGLRIQVARYGAEATNAKARADELATVLGIIQGIARDAKESE